MNDGIRGIPSRYALMPRGLLGNPQPVPMPHDSRLLAQSLVAQFDARNFRGLEAWWDASDAATVTLDSGRVSQLADKSGLGRHAANTTSGSTQPSYVTAAQNGLNVVRFTAASVQRLTVASSTAKFNFLHNGTDCCVFAVSKYATTSNPNAAYFLFGNNAGGNTGASILWDNRTGIGTAALDARVVSGPSLVASGRNAGNTAVLSAYHNLAPAQSYVVQEIILSPGNATLANRYRVRANGGSEVAANVQSATPNTGDAANSMQIGSGGTNTLPLEGDLCELMLFSQVPTDSARDVIRRYLGAKWGITVA